MLLDKYKFFGYTNIMDKNLILIWIIWGLLTMCIGVFLYDLFKGLILWVH